MSELKKLEEISPESTVTYLVGAMGKTAKKDGGSSWRQSLTPKLEKLGIVVLDPNAREKEKVGVDTLTFHKYLRGWKQAGHWDMYIEGHHKIWYGQDKYLEDGTLIHLPGDFDFVRHATFLVMHYERGDKPCGSFMEVGIAAYLRKPTYLITKVPVTKLSDSLVGVTKISKGEIFKNENQLLTFLKEEYK